MATPSLRRLQTRAAPLLGLSRCSRSLRWFVGFVIVLRPARVALHARRLVPHHCFNRVGQYHFALPTPTVDVSSWPQHCSPYSTLVHSHYLSKGDGFPR